MLELLQRDATWRGLPRWLLVALGASFTLLSIRNLVLLGSGPAAGGRQMLNSLLSILSLWGPLMPFLISHGLAPRCTPLDLALPIAPRRLWLARTCGLLFSGLLLVATVIGLGILLEVLRLRLLNDRLALMVPALGKQIIILIVGMIVAVTALQSTQPVLTQLPRRPGPVFLHLLSQLGVLGLVFLLAILPAAWALIPVAGALALAWRTIRGLPAALTLLPRAPEKEAGRGGHRAERADGAAPIAWVSQGRARPGVQALTIWRSLSGMLSAVIFYPILILYGGLLSSAFYLLNGDRDASLINLVLSWYLLIAVVAMSLRQLHLIDALPIPRQRIFAYLILPPLCCLILGYGATWAIYRAQYEETAPIRYVADDTENPLRVNLEYFEISWDGQPPPAEAPWGERHDAWAIPICPGLPPKLYKPYSAPAGSSPDFLAWQMSRALQTIYGRVIPADELMNRYIEVQEGGAIRVSPEDCATLLTDYPDLRESDRILFMFPVLMALVLIPALLLIALLLRKCRAGVSEAARRWYFVGTMAAILILQIGSIAAFISDLLSPVIITGFWKIVARGLESALPGGAVSVWIICGLLIWGFYRLARGQFMRIEIPASTQPCLGSGLFLLLGK